MGAGVHPKTVSFCLLVPRAPHGVLQGVELCSVSRVSFKLELTTPACPIKDEFERKARDYVSALPWVSQVRGQLLLVHIPLPAMHDPLHAWNLRQPPGVGGVLRWVQHRVGTSRKLRFKPLCKCKHCVTW